MSKKHGMKIAALMTVCYTVFYAIPALANSANAASGEVTGVTITKQCKMMVPARVNGVRGNFLVDTGAGNSYLTTRFAAGLNLPRDQGGYSYNVTGAMRFDVADAFSLELGENRIPVRHRLLHVSSFAWANRSIGSTAAGGIIGADILLWNRAVIDCSRGKIRMGALPRSKVPERTVSFRPRTGDEIAVVARVNGREGIFIVDTGYNVSVLSPEFAYGTGGTARTRTVNVRSLELGRNRLPVHLSRMTVTRGLSTANQGYIEQGELPYDGLLGMDFLMGNHVVIDCGARVLRFE